MEKIRITDRKMKNNRLNIIVLTARFLVGGIMIYASLDKIIDPAGFAKAIGNYHIVPFGLENTIAIVLPWIELLVGVCLIFGIFIDGAAFILVVLMAVFIIAITFAILSGYNIECGCGLKPGEMVGIRKIIEDLGYIIFSLIILFRPSQSFELYPK